MQSIGKMVTSLTQQDNYRATYEATVKDILAFPLIQQFIHEHEVSISQEMIANSLSKLNEYRLEMKAIERGETGKNPGFKPELYLNYDYIDVTYVPTTAYVAQQQQRQKAALLDNRMMSADVRQASLQHYDANSPQRVALLERVTDFLELYAKSPTQAQGLYITGSFGVGKTYLLGAVANYLAGQNVSVTMLHYPTFIVDIKQSIHDRNTQTILNSVKKVNVLMLDDIGAETNSPWVRDEVLSVILEYRMKESLPTFFTSNFTMAELETHLATTKDTDDLMKAKRLMERVRFLAKEVALHGENRRQR